MMMSVPDYRRLVANRFMATTNSLLQPIYRIDDRTSQSSSDHIVPEYHQTYSKINEFT